MIDREAIRRKFSEIARDRVGSYLTQVDGTPAVIPARTRKPKPEYPYLTVDLVDITQPNQDPYQYLDDVTDTEVYEISKTLMILYRVYGGFVWSDNEKNAQWIINELLNSFQLPSVIGEIENTVNCTPILTTDIDDLPVRLADGYLESTAFNVIVSVVDSVTDPDTFIIETVDLDGDVYPLQGEEDFYEVDITVTKP